MRRFAGIPFVIGIAFVAIVVSSAPSPYYLMTPGGSYEVEPRLTVPALYRAEMGRLAFTAVAVQTASWRDVPISFLDPSLEAVPIETVRPQGISGAEYQEINARLIEESKVAAAAVALRR